MRLAYSLALVLFTFTALARADEPSTFVLPGLDEPWVFFSEEDGASPEDAWSVTDDGVLHCEGAPLGYLRTASDYGDFTLSLEWRWPKGETPGKGGVLFRMTGEDKVWPKSLEAQINAGGAGDFWGLVGYEAQGPDDRTERIEHPRFGPLTHVARTKDLEREPGDWNAYRIEARGDVVTLWINGEPVNRATRCDTTPGKICLTAEGTPIEFRNFTLVIPAENDRADELPPPNILWINTEDISPLLGCYGDENAVTPNIDALARRGVLYRNAFSTAPICAPSRSCLATGLYATSLGTQHLRCEVRLPERIKTLAHYLREGAGYYCTNSGKSDYNFSPNGVWDKWSSEPAPWRSRDPGQPFYGMITIGGTHEGPTNNPEKYASAVEGLSPEKYHDPNDMVIPPFYPDTPETRRIWANLYDLISRMDERVGDVVACLEEDGDMDDTIVFFFADHGTGLPRYKRWLNDSGLRVPLIVYVPPKYRHLVDVAPGGKTDRLVSFVDFVPTALNAAGVDIPEHMPGKPFLGRDASPPRAFIFGARSRADDMFEISRSVSDGRYIYIRHYLPHYPYMQPGKIFSDEKWSFRVLRAMHAAGELPPAAERLWAARKPIEELYDLEADPHEIHNLADSPKQAERIQRLRARLHAWILAHRDVGFLPEAEGQIRGLSSTVFEMARDPEQYDLPRILDAAELVGREDASEETLIELTRDDDSGVRYWGVIALTARQSLGRAGVDALAAACEDSSPSVSIAAVEGLGLHGDCEAALPMLAKHMRDDRAWGALQAARSAQLIGPRAKPLVGDMRAVIEKNLGPEDGPRKYKDFNYASFTGWALEEALRNCGEEP